MKQHAFVLYMLSVCVAVVVVVVCREMHQQSDFDEDDAPQR